MSERLSEKQISDAFHLFLKNALSQARAEKLIPDQLLASAEADVMITGPALCLFFAALRSTSTPPGVILPRGPGTSPMLLSSQTCPPEFIDFFDLWSSCVPAIQSLTPQQQHDLARAICDLPPIAERPHPATGRIASDLRAVAIEISQRRTFQNRYAADLQAVLDSGSESGSIGRNTSAKATFVPPPAYDDENAPPQNAGLDKYHQQQSAVDETHLFPPTPTSPAMSTSSRSRSSRASGSSRSRSHSPVIILSDTDPVIDVIRETLYAALADVLSLAPSLRPLLSSDPTRAYFSSVALAVLDVSLNAVTNDGDVRGVLGVDVHYDECPAPLKPFMRELDGIARRAREISEEDDQAAMELLAEGKDEELAGRLTRMDRLKQMLERGVGYEERSQAYGAAPLHRDNSGRVSPNGTTIHLANRINALALGLTQLPAFRQRQGDVFKILAGVK